MNGNGRGAGTDRVDEARERARASAADAAAAWYNPDMSVLRAGVHPPPPFPMTALGPWRGWIRNAADAAAAPVDYTALPLLSAASAVIGNARWPQAWPGWAEPPHLWTCAVGASGSSKTPGADPMIRDVMPKIEINMTGQDYAEARCEWENAEEIYQRSLAIWKKEMKAWERAKPTEREKLPPKPEPNRIPEPHPPRLLITDITVEKVAVLLSTSSPKGMWLFRDELAGFVAGMNAYNDAGRQFWLECYGGRPYTVDRQKLDDPIRIPHLACAIAGTVQPERLAVMFRADPDDGFLSRILWAWPDAIPFRRGELVPDIAQAIDAFDQLRMLSMVPPEEDKAHPKPRLIPLSPDAARLLERFAADMQAMQSGMSGLLSSAFGKARGAALRLSLTLQYLWFAASGDMEPPREISAAALESATELVGGYFMSMAARVFGDAALPEVERNTTTLARWIRKTRAAEVHVRHLLREVRLPGLADAQAIHAACGELVAAGWLSPPKQVGFQERRREAYGVNPLVLPT